jgi:hypothetical protein
LAARTVVRSAGAGEAVSEKDVQFVKTGKDLGEKLNKAAIASQ